MNTCLWIGNFTITIDLSNSPSVRYLFCLNCKTNGLFLGFISFNIAP